MIPFYVREMRKDDIRRVMEIERRSFEFPWQESIFLEQFEYGDLAVSLVAEGKDGVCGYIIIWFEGKSSHILNLAVDGAWRGKGISDLLLREAISWSRGAGCGIVYLEVRKSNRRAIDFYERHGFGLAGKVRNYYRENGEDALIFSLRV